jgi:hypothetical protein
MKTVTLLILVGSIWLSALYVGAQAWDRTQCSTDIECAEKFGGDGGPYGGEGDVE